LLLFAVIPCAAPAALWCAVSERDIADAEWAARAVRDSIRLALLMASAELALLARLLK
jgi:hypothetical protein